MFQTMLDSHSQVLIDVFTQTKINKKKQAGWTVLENHSKITDEVKFRLQGLD